MPTDKIDELTPDCPALDAADAGPDDGDDEDIPEVLGSQALLDRFLPAALLIAPQDVLPFRADAALAYHNVRRGLDEVLPHEARLREELPRANFDEVAGVADLALALVFSRLQVQHSPVSPKTTQAKLQRGRKLRRKLLAAADALAEADLIPQAEVNTIRKGKGPEDTAQDCIALPALFRKYRKLVAGKSAVTEAEIVESDRVGVELQAILVPERGVPVTKPEPESARAREVSNRLWTLLVLRHQMLWKMGAWLWAQAVDEHVPTLQARLGRRHKNPPADGSASG